MNLFALIHQAREKDQNDSPVFSEFAFPMTYARAFVSRHGQTLGTNDLHTLLYQADCQGLDRGLVLFSLAMAECDYLGLNVGRREALDAFKHAKAEFPGEFKSLV